MRLGTYNSYISISSSISLPPTRSYIKIIPHGIMEDITSSRGGRLPGETEFFYAKKSTAISLLKHATGWVGDDLEELLKKVHEMRGMAEF